MEPTIQETEAMLTLVMGENFPATIQFTQYEVLYLKQLNAEILYAKKAFDGFVGHLRKEYEAPATEWVLNNIDTGFQHILTLKEVTE